MSLIVETGAIVAGAESYISVAETSAFHAARGDTTWAIITTAQMEQALRRATDYMVHAYRLRWLGSRVSTAQTLDWPRSLVPIVDSPVCSYVETDVVPDAVKNACAMLARRAAAGPLLDDQERTKTSVKVGPIETAWAAGSSQAKKYAEIDALLRPYLTGGAGQIPMVRQ